MQLLTNIQTNKPLTISDFSPKPVLLFSSTLEDSPINTPLVVGTAKTATFTPKVLSNSNYDIQDITVTGVLVGKNNSVSILTPIVSFSDVEITGFVLSNDIVRVIIKNFTDTVVTLPILTISVIQLN